MEKIEPGSGEKPLSGEVARVTDLIQYQEGAVVSRTLVKKASGSVTLFAFDRSQGLSEHTAPYDALVQVLDGEAQRVKQGEMILMPADQPHELKAVTRFKMLLTMLRS